MRVVFRRAVGRMMLGGACLLAVASCRREATGKPLEEQPAERTHVKAVPNMRPTDGAQTDRLQRRIAGCLGLLDADDPIRSAVRLAELKNTLEAAGDAAAARAIVSMLKSGRDTRTGLRFRVGAEGVLASAPTLRIALMDWLPGFDPDAALDMARATLNAAASPDECALALRNIAWNDLDGDLRDELHLAFEMVMTQPSWRGNPTPGFLEALDVGVELGDARAFRLVSGLLDEASGKDTGDLLRASFIALDRMIVRNPMLLRDVPRDFPAMQRAALFSRLDPAADEQRVLLAGYLENLSNPEEAAEFAALFPNGNQFQGNWLVTASEPMPSIREQWERDRATLGALDQLGSNLSPAGRKAMETVRMRLEEFLSGAPPE